MIIDSSDMDIGHGGPWRQLSAKQAAIKVRYLCNNVHKGRAPGGFEVRAIYGGRFSTMRFESV